MGEKIGSRMHLRPMAVVLWLPASCLGIGGAGIRLGVGRSSHLEGQKYPATHIGGGGGARGGRMDTTSPGSNIASRTKRRLLKVSA